MQSFRVIISGGGTGGHIFPAIAIANEIKAIYPDADILFVGAKGKMEMQKVPEAGYRIEGLWISGIERSASWKNLIFPIKITNSLIRSVAILRRFRPDVVIGVGGFASGAVMYAANLMGIPTVIQEQNSYPGITNKLLAGKAKLICVAYPNMERFFPKQKIKITGNPVRKDITEITSSEQKEAYQFFGLNPEKKTLLAMGGSLGSRTINEAIAEILPIFVENNWQLIWQTGKSFESKIPDLQQEYAHQGIFILPFIKEMKYAYNACDVVVSRAGALSVSELCIVGKPTIFVPYPYAAEDHQTKNALALVEKEAALLVKDGDAQKKLLPAILALMNDDKKRLNCSEKMKELAKPAATKEIVSAIVLLLS